MEQELAVVEYRGGHQGARFENYSYSKRGPGSLVPLRHSDKPGADKAGTEKADTTPRIVVGIITVVLVTLSLLVGSSSNALAQSIQRPSIVGQLEIPAAELQDFIVLQDRKIHVYHQRNDGSFARVQVLPESLPGVDDPVLGDFNGDGYIDIAALGPSYSDIYVFYNDGKGFFGDPVRIAQGQSYTGLHVADVNNDGLTDLVAHYLKPNFTAFPSTPTISAEVFLSLGTHGFIAVPRIEELATVYSMAPADVNRDGYIDMAMFALELWQGQGIVGVARNLGNRSTSTGPEGYRGFDFSEARGIADSINSRFASILDTVDLNRDGYPDIVYSSRERLLLSFSRAPSVVGGLPTYQSSVRLDDDRLQGYLAKGIDLNADGRTDLLMAVTERGGSDCAFNAIANSGEFPSRSYEFCPEAFSLGSINDDTLTDVAAAGRGQVVFYRSTGDGRLVETTRVGLVSKEPIRSFTSRSLQRPHRFYGVVMQAGSELALADDTGRFVLNDLNPGVHEITGSSPQWEIAPRTVTVSRQQPAFSSFRASFVSQRLLPSPTYTLWNGYLEMVNILEMINRSESENTVTVSLFGIDGSLATRQEIRLQANQQFDLILNQLQGFKKDSYGIVEVRFSAPLDGRVSYYRGARNGEYEFAFNLAFAEPLRGKSAVSFNTYNPSHDPVQANQVVHNWLSIVNLAGGTRTFLLEKYSESGLRLSQVRVAVPAFGRLDVDGGHENPGPSSVGVNIVTPDSADPYLLQLIRYGSNAAPGQITTGYSFAFALPGVQGTATELAAPLSRQFLEENWVEVVNTSGQASRAQLYFLTEGGQLVHTETVDLPAFGQRHFYASQFLGAGEAGQLILAPSAGSRIIAQSMFYFRSAISGRIKGMYGSSAKLLTHRVQSGSYNLFLGMENWLTLANPHPTSTTVYLALPSTGFRQTLTLAAWSTIKLPIHQTRTFSTKFDTYGQLQLVSSKNVLAEMLRLKLENDGREVDFVMPTKVH